MKPLLISLLFILNALSTVGQPLYSKAFGKPTDNPIIFLHGGPGSSSVYFEATTAKKLANQGFYVIIYDRKGEGRSANQHAKMNFEEAFNDLNDIYKKYGLTKANLIGFSFGGLITSQYAIKFPDKVKSIILVSALLSQQASYHTILNSTEKIYTQQDDGAGLDDLHSIAKMDTNSIGYRTAVFKHAIKNGYFSLKNPDSLAKVIYSTYKTDPLIKSYVKNEQAVETFWKHELLKNINVLPQLKMVKNAGIPIYALYGKQDGLYSKNQVAQLSKIVGVSRLKYLDNCSHTLFIDQQTKFIESLKGWLN